MAGARTRGVAAVLLAVALLILGGCVFAPAPRAAWPPSASGLPVFYYFGDPG